MRRYLRPSGVNRPVSAWGLYKSNDEQTHSDDLCRRWGWRGGNRVWLFACPRAAGLSGTTGRDLFTGAAALSTSARRLSDRISPWSGRAEFRRAGRRRRTEWAEFRRAAAARPGAFTRRSALWPADGCPAGLFRAWPGAFTR